MLKDVAKYRGFGVDFAPKYDGDWVKMMGVSLIRDFQGAHIIADTHYETANRTLSSFSPAPNVLFYTPIAKPRGKKRKRTDDVPVDPSAGAAVLTKEQQSWNARVAHVRARVESPFGLIKAKWKGLGDVFYGDTIQQDYLVRIAAATHN